MSPVEPGESCPQCSLTAGSYIPAPHHLRPGSMLMDRYLVGRVLGEGGFGITYIGCDLRLEMKVAIKEYYPVDKVNRNAEVSTEVLTYQVGPTRESFERGKYKFLQEARAMARMDKQQVIVSVRDFFETNSTAYIVMEYIDGTTLTELVAQKGGRIPPQELFPMLDPLFKALGVLHEQGLIHRDIAPDNIMLEDGAIRLIDFGCARGTETGNDTLTITLKHGYAPIEQYQQKGQGPWTDVYALCATIYFCLTGKKPPQALDRIGGDMALLLPSRLGIRLTPKQEEALMKGLNLSPKGRFATMEELHGALYSPPDLGELPMVQPLPEEPLLTRQEAFPKTDAVLEEVSGPEPDVQEESTQPEEPATPEKTSQKSPWYGRHIKLALLGSVCLALVVLLAQPFLKKDPAPRLTPTGSDPVMTTESSLFAEAGYLLTGEDLTQEGFLRCLNDPNITAMVLPEGSFLHLGYQSDGSHILLTKPLQVGQGAVLSVAAVTVADAGYIEVLGEMDVANGDLRLQGKQLRLSFPYGTQEHLRANHAVLWAQNADAVDQRVGADFQAAGGKFLVFQENMSRAREVKTAQELYALRDQSVPEGIKITQDIVLTADMWITDFPIYVCEGVTVSTEDGGMWGFLLGRSSVLVNYGTILSAIYTDGGHILNYGRMALGDGAVGVSLWMNENANAVFLNEGILTAVDVSRLWPGCHLLNTARGQVIAEDLYFLGSSMTNYGMLEVPEQIPDRWYRLVMDGGSYLFNAGSFTVGSRSTFNSAGFLHNVGEMKIQAEANLGNTGVVFNDEGAFWADASVSLHHAGSVNTEKSELPVGCGLYCTRGGTFQATESLTVYHLPMEKPTAGTVVSTQEELERSLADSAVQTVIVPGNLAYVGDLALVQKNVIVSGSLQVSGMLQADGAGIYLEGEGRLATGPMRMYNSLMVIREESGLAIGENCTFQASRSLVLGLDNGKFQALGAEITLNDWAAIVGMPGCSENFLQAAGGNLHMYSRAFLLPNCLGQSDLHDLTMTLEEWAMFSAGKSATLRDCAITLNADASMVVRSWKLNLLDSQIAIEKGGLFFADLSNVSLDSSTLTSRSCFTFWGWDEYQLTLRNSAIENAGDCAYLGIQTVFYGEDSHVRNQSTLHLSHTGAGEPVVEESRIRGNGRVVFDN